MNSGIYMIQNVINGNRYVGSSRNLRHRKASHFSELRNNYHGNHRIQKEYNQYGESYFKWVVLERCSAEVLVEREQWWLDNTKPEYNVLLKADNHLCLQSERNMEAARKRSIRMTGRKASEETKKKMSLSHIERYKNPEAHEKLRWTPEKHAYFKEILSGENNPNWGKKRSPEFKNMIGNLFSSVEYTYTSPTGEYVTFTNLIKFCKENNLSYTAMRSLHQKRRKSPYLGWVFKEKRFIGYNKE